MDRVLILTDSMAATPQAVMVAMFPRMPEFPNEPAIFAYVPGDVAADGFRNARCSVMAGRCHQGYGV